MVCIATWNVNSVRPRLEHLLEWLKTFQPDVALLQETKVVNEAFPQEQVEELGYNLALNGQKTYNGVAILSKGPLEDISTTFPNNPDESQARYIEAITTIENTVLRVASVYVPNGQEVGSDKFAYKMAFLEALRKHLHTLLGYEEQLVVGGDYNVAPYPADVYNPDKLDGSVCYHPDERSRFRALQHLGLTDAFRATHPDEHSFSWWDYRGGGWQNGKGMRIDHLLLSPQATDHLAESGIDADWRAKPKPSDHAPVWCKLQKAA